jgi:hypothetical protein
VAATFEKANTYVFAAPIIRDREVGGSNPLAPTTTYLQSTTVFVRRGGQFVDRIPCFAACHYQLSPSAKNPPKTKKRERSSRMVQVITPRNRALAKCIW